jgi:putative ABC transport system ATP-binding protein
MAEPLLEARGLDKTYRRGAERVHALRGVGLALYPGELVALVGPSGSGKSSLLGVLAGWEPPDAGELTWAPGRGAGGRAPGRAGARTAPGWAELATVPQALGLADRSPSETSLGQQQRAAVARALVLTPQLVLADEPSAHQDAAWVHDVFAALRQVVHDRGAACLVATHDPDALQFADRVLHLVDGELTERSP